jgi:hypothetical protein
MLSWVTRAVNFAKGLVSTYQALKNLQLQTKDATIQMQKEHIDLLADHLSLKETATGHQIDQLTKKLEMAEIGKQHFSDATIALTQILHVVLEKVIPEVGNSMSRYADARGRLSVALKISAYRQNRLAQGNDPVSRVLPFIRDMDLFAAQEVGLAAEQVLAMMNETGVEEFPGARAFFEEALKWSQREQGRLLKTHALPDLSGTSTPKES